MELKLQAMDAGNSTHTSAHTYTHTLLLLFDRQRVTMYLDQTGLKFVFLLPPGITSIDSATVAHVVKFLFCVWVGYFCEV